MSEVYMDIDLMEIVDNSSNVIDALYDVLTFRLRGSATSTEFMAIYNTIVTRVGNNELTATQALKYALDCYNDGVTTASNFKSVYNGLAVSWANADWEYIGIVADAYYSGLLSLNDVKGVWSVGNSKPVSLTSTSSTASQNVAVKIVDFNHDTLDESVGGKTNALLTFAFVLSENGVLGSSGWQNSAIRTMLNGDVISAMPTGMKGLLKSVEKASDGGGTSMKTAVTTSDKLFIPSSIEFTNGNIVSGRNYHSDITYGVAGGTQYAHYTNANNRKFGKSVWTTTSDSYYHSGAGKRYYGWSIYITTDGGRYDADSNFSLGIVAHGCI